MNLKLWLMSKIALPTTPTGTRRQDKARDLPQEIGRQLVVERGLDPDWVWSLKYVRKRREESKAIFDIRIFNPLEAAKKNLKIRDYEALNDHMELVLMSGSYDKANAKASLDYSKLQNAGT